MSQDAETEEFAHFAAFLKEKGRIVMTKSMTEGNPLKLLIQFAFPLLLGNLFQQTYNTMDAAIVGRFLGTDALASVGASSSVQFLILGFCIGTCCGFAIPVAQRFGAKDYRAMKSYVYHAAVLSAVIAVVLTVVCALLCPQILHMMLTPEEIYDGAYIYLLIIFLGIPFNILYNLLAGLLRSVGDSRTPFVFLAMSTVLNVFLDLFCIIVLKWGVAGAAIATITSQAMSGIFCLFYIVKKCPILHFEREHRNMQRSYSQKLLIMGLPMGLQFSITAIGSMVMQAANNGLGTVYVSGFTAGVRLKQLFMCPFDAFSTAVATFCGQNVGARRMDRVRRGILDGILITVGYGILSGLVLIFFGRNLSGLFLTGGEKAGAVMDAAGQYLRCMGYFYWTLGILNVSRQAIQGMGFAGRAVFAGVVEMAARCIVSLGFTPVFGYMAICFADQTAWVSVCLYLVPMCIYCIRKLEKLQKGIKA